MTSWVVLQLALLVVALLLVGLGFAAFAQRGLRSRALERRSRRESFVRPRMMRLLSDDSPDLSSLDDLSSDELKVAENLAWQLLTKVRGSSRAALVAWLERRGAIERMRLQTASRSVVRRASAAERLGAAGVASTSQDVVRLLDDTNSEVRIVAARALGKLGDAGTVGKLLDSMTGERPLPASIISMALLHVGPAAVEGLVAGLGSRSSAVRSIAAELLGMHGAISAERWLMLMIEHDPVIDVRVHASAALGRIGSPHALDVLGRTTRPSEPQALRVASTRSLGLIGGKDAVATLQTLLSDDVEEVGLTACESLTGCGIAGENVLRMTVETDGLARDRAQDWMSRVELEHGSRRHRRMHEMGGHH